MTTLCISDASSDLQARIDAAKARRDALGIVPIEHRPVRESDGVPLHVDPDVPVAVLTEALRAAGLAVINRGGRYVVRTNAVVA